MALTIATQLEIDGPRNTVSKTTGDLLGSDFPQAGNVILDPSTLSSMLPGVQGSFLASKLRIDEIQYSLADDLILQLFWDAGTPVLIAELYGRGQMRDLACFGGLQNNATNPTGKITATLVYGGNTAVITTASYSFFFILRVCKQRAVA